MKIVILICLVLSSSVFSQNSGKVTYEIKTIDFEQQGLVKNMDIENALAAAKKHQFTLEFNSNMSKFYINEFANDESDSMSKFYNVMAMESYTTSKTFFYDKITSNILKKGSDNVTITMQPKQNWEITSDSKHIDKYLCYKAILKIDYLARNGKNLIKTITAWFAPNLPYAYGPKEFVGLPGLILELTERETTYLASKIELSNKQTEIEFPKGKIITQEEYDKKMSSY